MSQQLESETRDRDPRRQAPTAGLGKIEAVATATAIIDFLAERGSKVGVQDVATMLGITKSRASRHLANLEQLGLVGRQGSRGYELGWRLVRWGHIAAARLDLVAMLDDYLVALGREVGLTVLLCTDAGGDAVVVRSIPRRRRSISTSSPGWCSACRIRPRRGSPSPSSHASGARNCSAICASANPISASPIAPNS